MSNWNPETINQAIELFKQRTAIDEEFRALALKDAAQAVRELTGSDVPEGYGIRVQEGPGSELNIVLMDLEADDALDESELELVTGGTSFSAFILYGPSDAPPKKKKK